VNIFQIKFYQWPQNIWKLIPVTDASRIRILIDLNSWIRIWTNLVPILNTAYPLPHTCTGYPLYLFSLFAEGMGTLRWCTPASPWTWRRKLSIAFTVDPSHQRRRWKNPHRSLDLDEDLSNQPTNCETEKGWERGMKRVFSFLEYQ